MRGKIIRLQGIFLVFPKNVIYFPLGKMITKCESCILLKLYNLMVQKGKKGQLLIQFEKKYIVYFICINVK